MRIAYTSDLHVDISQRNWELVPYLAEVLKIIDPDVFILAGDVSPEIGDLEYALDCFATLRSLKLFVPGNQDIWVLSEEMQSLGHDSYEKYYFYLPEACRRNDFVPLWMEPVVCRGVGFAGSIGWYDSALGAGGYGCAFPREHLYLLDSVWNDMRWACWADISTLAERGMTPVKRADSEVAREFNLRLDQDVEALSRDAAVKEIVVVTHYPPFQELSVEEIPFPGSRETGGILFAHPKVTISISGHIHDRRDILVGNIRAVRCPVGYLGRERQKYQEIVKDCLEVMHILEGDEFLGRELT